MPGSFILNVDDNEAGRYARTCVLEKAGLQVREAENGAQALQLVHAEHPGLVLLDVNLPDMSGYEVCRRIKAGRVTAAIPVLQISSSFIDRASQVAGLDAGAEAYLVEPVDPEILIATVKALLRARSMHEQLEAEVERRRRAEDALRSSNLRLRLLSELSSDLLSQEAPPEKFVTDLYKRFSSELGLEICFHFQVVENGERLRLCAWGGVSDEIARQIEWLDFGQAVCGTVALQQQRIVAEDIQQSHDPLTELVRSMGITAYVCHPLLAKGRLLGTLSFGTRSRPRFEQDEVDLLQTLCSQVALALERRSLRADLLFQASLLGQVRNAVIATDLEGKIVYWNKAAEAMYQWNVPEVLGRNITEITVPPASAAKAAEALSVIAETGYWEGEFRVRRKDGSIFDALVSDAALHSPEGSAIGYVGVTVDLSEQKRAQEVVRQSEEKYRRIVETTAEGVWVIDADGRTTFTNERMAAMLGYSLDEMQNRSVSDLVFEEDLSNSLNLLERRRNGISEDFESRLRRKDGSAIWTRISASALQDAEGNFIGALRMVSDITERKRAQQAIEESERKLRRLVESNIIGVLTGDAQRIVEANAVFLEMVRYDRKDLLAGRLRWREMTPPEYADLDRRALNELLSQGTCRPFEKEYYRSDGTRVPVLIGAAMLNEPTEWLCFALDLTERKRTEEALREIQKFESLGFMAGGVAHNLNNILVGIMGNVSLVLEAPGLGFGDRLLLDEAIKNSERAANLTTQLLAYAGKGRIIPQPIDLSACVGNLIGLLRSSISKKIDLRCNLAKPLPVIEADEGQIRQVISSLVINAAEAIGDKEGTIEITTRLEEFDDSNIQAFTSIPFTAGAYIVLEVSDTGCGMDEAIKSKIFDPFFSTKFTGRGLGLAAVAGIVRSQKGAIEVSTAPGKGSRFQVFLPAARAHEVRHEDAGVLISGSAVLVVDDEESVLRMAKAALERSGFTAVLAENGGVAAEIMRRRAREIGLVLLDIAMPGISGKETLEAMQSLRPDVPVIISSAYSETEILRQFWGKRLAGVLQKPYTAQTLVEKVTRALRSSGIASSAV